MKNWKVELPFGGESLAEVKILRGIFKGDALSPLLFVRAMMPLNHLGNAQWDKNLLNPRKKINRLMYMDDMKLFATNKKELETLIQGVRVYNQDIGIELGREKCDIKIMRSRKRDMTETIELPNQEKIRMFGEKETNKY